MSIFSSLRYCLSGEPNQLYLSMLFMPFGLFFDFMDGKVARWRKKSSLMGQELDSLADLVFFFPSFFSSPPTSSLPHPKHESREEGRDLLVGL